MQILQSSPENLKKIIIIVHKWIEYLLFRFYSTDKMMIKANKLIRKARNERLEREDQFLIPLPT